VIYGKQIWLTSATKDGRELFALCIDRDTGKIIRDWKLFDVAQPQFVHPFNTPASPTPVIEEGRVYITFGSAGAWVSHTRDSFSPKLCQSEVYPSRTSGSAGDGKYDLHQLRRELAVLKRQSWSPRQHLFEPGCGNRNDIVPSMLIY
jgi:hypothetical protein